MFTIQVPLSSEGFDNATQKFVAAETFELRLEHSLVSLSKWEEEFEKPFLSKDEKTEEEAIRYIQIMTGRQEIPDFVWGKLSAENVADINEFMESKMTATWFAESKDKPSHEIITAELIYYWMVALEIPLETQHWHLNKLFTLIKVCNLKNQPEKKLTKAEAAQRTREINERNRAKYNSNG